MLSISSGLRLFFSFKTSTITGLERFVNQMGSFLVIVGLAGLAVGGVGISSAVRSWLERKTRSIATLKVLGAESGLIFRIYLIQTAILAGLGIADPYDHAPEGAD